MYAPLAVLTLTARARLQITLITNYIDLITHITLTTHTTLPQSQTIALL